MPVSPRDSIGLPAGELALAAPGLFFPSLKNELAFLLATLLTEAADELVASPLA